MDEKRMTIVGHLTDLYKTIIWCLVVFAIGFIIAYIKSEAILNFLTAPAPEDVFYAYEPTETFMAQLKVAFYAGLVIASPAMAFFISRFVAPGLTPRERVWIPIMVLCSVALFVISTILVYKIVVPTVLKFLLFMTPGGIETKISIRDYISFVLGFITSFGVALQFPFILALLIITGIVDADALAKRRIYVIVVIAAAGAIISFGVDIVTQVLFFGPIYILFELSLLVGRAVRKSIIRRRNNTVRG